jgi:1-deoxy-D-xylulose-5-phosphate synthase
VAVRLHGLPDEFIEHGTPQELHAMCKLDAAGIAEVVRDFLLWRQKEGAAHLIPS